MRKNSSTHFFSSHALTLISLQASVLKIFEDVQNVLTYRDKMLYLPNSCQR